ncbi:MAG: hypothetical protein JOZ07_16050 [Solirubrobacterales bacterium]|nr:hypothetical protein [Solirubrobacterales bacterium]
MNLTTSILGSAGAVLVGLTVAGLRWSREQEGKGGEDDAAFAPPLVRQPSAVQPGLAPPVKWVSATPEAGAPPAADAEPEPVALDAPGAEPEAVALDEPGAEFEPAALDAPGAEFEPVALDAPGAEPEAVALDEPVALDAPGAEPEPVALDAPGAEPEAVALDEPGAEFEPARLDAHFNDRHAEESAALAPADEDPHTRLTRGLLINHASSDLGAGMQPSAEGGFDGDTIYELGLFFYSRGYPGGAETAWRHAAAAGHAQAATRLGMLLEQRGDLDAAREAYEHGERGGDPAAAGRAAALRRSDPA